MVAAAAAAFALGDRRLRVFREPPDTDVVNRQEGNAWHGAGCGADSLAWIAASSVLVSQRKHAFAIICSRTTPTRWGSSRSLTKGHTVKLDAPPRFIQHQWYVARQLFSRRATVPTTSRDHTPERSFRASAAIRHGTTRNTPSDRRQRFSWLVCQQRAPSPPAVAVRSCWLARRVAVPAPAHSCVCAADGGASVALGNHAS